MEEKFPSPCFVLDEVRLEKNLQLLKRVQSETGVDIILAFKGFAMWSAFPLVRKYLKGATASSLNEVKLCVEEMKCKAHTYSVAYTEDEIDQILQSSSHITFNSLNQFERYREKAKKWGVSCGIRVNPEFSDVSTDLYNPSAPDSRLGMTKEHFANGLPEGIDGLHFHVLCESDSYALKGVLEALEARFGNELKKVKWVNMGGGHAITRAGYDVDHLIDLLRKFKEKYKVDVVLEPGSAVAWQTGELQTTVLDIVENGGVKTAIIDGSFTCHMPDCLEMPYRPKVKQGHTDRDIGSYKYKIGGVSCLAGDYLDTYSFDNELHVGDQLIFEDMIHYTMVKTTTFNGVKHPSIGIIRRTGELELVRTFGYNDYKDRLS
ncbi:carboxynorspermidine decarboxylase [Reichenbachiella sp. MALMAid0571]|uniref:carboxynorspermidine decarboxylase n=1 Tax=Reichenbachiella sp. MALMAid0571 TaxID=3143939 RepID=UPI0032E03286